MAAMVKRSHQGNANPSRVPVRKPGRPGSAHPAPGVEGSPPSPNSAATKWPGLAGPRDLGTVKGRPQMGSLLPGPGSASCAHSR